MSTHLYLNMAWFFFFCVSHQFECRWSLQSDCTIWYMKRTPNRRKGMTTVRRCFSNSPTSSVSRHFGFSMYNVHLQILLTIIDALPVRLNKWQEHCQVTVYIIGRIYSRAPMPKRNTQKKPPYCKCAVKKLAVLYNPIKGKTSIISEAGSYKLLHEVNIHSFWPR